MDRDTVVARVHKRLGNRSGLDTDIRNEIQLTQETLEHGIELPWFLKTNDATLVTVASVATVALPTDYLRDIDENPLWIQDTTGLWNIVTKERLDVLKAKVYETDPSLPRNYALFGESVHLFPTPDAVYPLDFYYYGADTVVTSNIENQWLKYAPNLIISSVGLEIAAYSRDAEALAYFTPKVVNAVDLLLRENVSRDEAGMKPTMGG